MLRTRAPGVALHELVRGSGEAELLVERMRVLGVEQPFPVGEGAAFDHLAYELDAEPATPEGRQDVDVGEIDERDPVGDGAAEADLAAAVIQADDAGSLAHEAGDGRVRASARPVRLVREIVVDGVDVDSRGIVVEDEAVRELAVHVSAGSERSQTEAAVVLVRRRDDRKTVPGGAFRDARARCLRERTAQERLHPGKALLRERKRAGAARVAHRTVRKRVSASNARGLASCSLNRRSTASSPIRPTLRRYGSS